MCYTNAYYAGVAELADATDSKSVGLITRAGSTPATGTEPGGDSVTPVLNLLFFTFFVIRFLIKSERITVYETY